MKILIIDEDNYFLTDIKKALTKLNFMIKTNNESNNIMELLKNEIFDVLIYTVQEKIKENLILLEKIKYIFKNLKIILITEFVYLKNEKQCLYMAADALLEKPFNLNNLIQYLNQFNTVDKLN